MLIWVEKIVALKVCNEVSLDNFFKYLDDMRCQRDRSVVDSISFAISFVVWCYHWLFEGMWDCSFHKAFLPEDGDGNSQRFFAILQQDSRESVRTSCSSWANFIDSTGNIVLCEGNCMKAALRFLGGGPWMVVWQIFSGCAEDFTILVGQNFSHFSAVASKIVVFIQ